MRPVGKRIIEVCEVIEMYGPCGYAVVTSETDIPRENASKYCIRAVSYGLMTVDKPENRGTRAAFSTYSVVPNWREMTGSFAMDSRKRLEPMREKPRKRTTFSYINSVFGLGAI